MKISEDVLRRLREIERNGMVYGWCLEEDGKKKWK